MTHQRRIGYPHVVSTMALVVALGTGGAYASSLAKNSVTTKQIKNGTIKTVDLGADSVAAGNLAPGAVPNPLTDGSVTTAKLGDGSVTAAKLAPGAVPNASIPDGTLTGAKLQDGSVTGAKVADNSLTGADVDESTLGTVNFATRSLTVLAASVDSNGTLAPNQSFGAVSTTHPGTGTYTVTFNRDLSTCAPVAGGARSAGTSGAPDDSMVSVAYQSSTTVSVTTRDDANNNSNRAFTVLIVC